MPVVLPCVWGCSWAGRDKAEPRAGHGQDSSSGCKEQSHS